MTTATLTRTEVVQQIRMRLRERSGKSWSVTGGRGSAYGWITITRKPNESMMEHESRELAELLGLSSAHHQGVKIPASTQYYQEFLDRAEGKAPSVVGVPYWD